MEQIKNRLEEIRIRVEAKHEQLAKIKRPSNEEIECRFHCFYLNSLEAHKAYHEGLKNNIVYEEYEKKTQAAKSIKNSPTKSKNN